MASLAIGFTAQANSRLNCSPRHLIARCSTKPGRGSSRFWSHDAIRHERRGTGSERMAWCTVQGSSQGALGSSYSESVACCKCVVFTPCCNMSSLTYTLSCTEARSRHRRGAHSRRLYAPSTNNANASTDTLNRSARGKIFLLDGYSANTSYAASRSSNSSSTRFNFPSSTARHGFYDDSFWLS